MILGFTACNSIKPEVTTKETPQKSKTLTIDLDKEIKIKEATGELRDSSGLLVDEPIYIGDNDEVSFKGDIMEKNSPLTIKIGSKDDITFSGKSYTLKTIELKDGETIQIKDKNGKIFVNVAVTL